MAKRGLRTPRITRVQTRTIETKKGMRHGKRESRNGTWKLLPAGTSRTHCSILSKLAFAYGGEGWWELYKGPMQDIWLARTRNRDLREGSSLQEVSPLVPRGNARFGNLRQNPARGDGGVLATKYQRMPRRRYEAASVTREEHATGYKRRH